MNPAGGEEGVQARGQEELQGSQYAKCSRDKQEGHQIQGIAVLTFGKGGAVNFQTATTTRAMELIGFSIIQ